MMKGFGSIVVPRPNAMTKSIIKAVEKGQSSPISMLNSADNLSGRPSNHCQGMVLPRR